MQLALAADQPRDDHGRWVSSGTKEASPAGRAALRVADAYRTAIGAGGVHTGVVDPGLRARADALGFQVNLKGLDTENQRGVLNALEKFHAAYPAVRVEVHAVDPRSYTGKRKLGPDAGHIMATTWPGTIPIDNLNGAAGFSQIYLNRDFFVSSSALQETMANDQRAGFLARGVADPSHGPASAAEQTMEHELAHALSNSLGVGGTSGTDYMRAFTRVVNDPFFTDKNVAAISRYATQDDREFVAEAMASMHGPNPTPLARTVESVFGAAYHAKYG